MSQQSKSVQGRASQTPRGNDRRVSKEIGPPPFVTAAGLVNVERRSHCERRAVWLREFTLDMAAR